MPLYYIFKRLGTFIITLFAALTIIFLITRFAPGDPIGALLTQMSQRGQQIPGGEKLVEEYRKMFGMDGTLWVQYKRFIGQLLHVGEKRRHEQTKESADTMHRKNVE